MRVGVVYFSERKEDKVAAMAKGIARGIGKQGYQVDLINGIADSQTKLSLYQYIVAGTEPLTWVKGRIPEGITDYLSQAGIVTGKRCSAFIIKGLGAERGLRRLMKAMEHEGMMLHFSEVLGSPEEAEAMGEIVQVERP